MSAETSGRGPCEVLFGYSGESMGEWDNSKEVEKDFW